MTDPRSTPRLMPALRPRVLRCRAETDGPPRASRAALALLLLELDAGMVRLLQVLEESARPEPVALARLEALGLVDDGAVTPLGSELLGAMVVPA